MSDMDQQSSEYLQYLPPFFREAAGDGTATGEFLPNLLKVFQKILTGVKNKDGIEDDIKIEDRSGKRIYEPLEAVIDQLDRFFDPFRTDPKFLEWLASWVALELRPDWTPAEQRKMIARMVQISRRIGLKAGLYDYLDIYAKEAIRPRVSIDDDEAVFRVVLRDDGPAEVNVLAFAQIFEAGGRKTPILYRPSAIAVLENANPELVRYVVADAGLLDQYPPTLPPALWLLKPNGELDETIHWTGSVDTLGRPIPRSLNTEPYGQYRTIQDEIANEGYRLTAPVAVVVDDKGLLVLDQGNDYGGGFTAPPTIFRYPLEFHPLKRSDLPRTDLGPLGKTVNDSYPIDMVLDRKASPKRLIVLDRKGQRGEPRLCVLELRDGASSTPRFIALDPTIVVTPTAIVHESDNTFVIADARDDPTVNPGPGVLVRVTIDDLTKPTPTVSAYDIWDPKPPEKYPLIYPTGLAMERAGVFLVCDSGFKVQSGRAVRAFRTMAEPAGLFRVNWGARKVPQFKQLVYRDKLMRPTKLALDPPSTLLVTDQGETDDTLPNVPWRGIPHRFGVSVLFSMVRLPETLFREGETTPTEDEEAERNLKIQQLESASRGIELVVEQQKPLQSLQVWKIQK